MQREVRPREVQYRGPQAAAGSWARREVSPGTLVFSTKDSGRLAGKRGCVRFSTMDSRRLGSEGREHFDPQHQGQ